MKLIYICVAVLLLGGLSDVYTLEMARKDTNEALESQKEKKTKSAKELMPLIYQAIKKAATNGRTETKIYIEAIFDQAMTEWSKLDVYRYVAEFLVKDGYVANVKEYKRFKKPVHSGILNIGELYISWKKFEFDPLKHYNAHFVPFGAVETPQQSNVLLKRN